MNDFEDRIYDEDFALTGEMELDELDDADTAVEMQQLMSRVTATRLAGV
ncbi:MAG TPA: hypothetical protein VFB08_13185 [Burkholderiales bacterium]|nr:hypothetical protein [Burkholderiales bacterium]